MIDIKKPIELLPPYYQDNDTYRDAGGKGILERFLSVIGEYFYEEIKQPVDVLLDTLIDVDTLDLKLLNLIWEYLGSVPYSYGTIIENNISLYGGKGITTYEDNEKPRARYRDLIKHIISLYKIRGTLDFYPALLRFYNYDCIVRDPTGDFINPESQLASGNYVPQYDNSLIYDSTVTYDESSIGVTCINIRLTISIPLELKDHQPFRLRLYKLLNRFRPIHIVPFGVGNVTFTVDGVVVSTGFPYTFPFILNF